MTIKIDDSTGLPKLPKGQWWEVVEVPSERFEETNYFYSTYRHPEARHFRVRIMHSVKVPASVEYRDRGWWRSAEPVVIPESTRAEVLASKKIGEFQQPRVEHGVTFGGHWKYEAELTPEVVLKYATKLVEREEAKRIAERLKEAENAVTKSLLGAYPPKSIKRSVAV